MDSNDQIAEVDDTRPFKPNGKTTPEPPTLNLNPEIIPEPRIRPIPQARGEHNSTSSRIQPVSPAMAKAWGAKKSFAAPTGKRIQATYPLQKPPKNKFVRVHPSPNYHLLGVLTLTDLDTGEIYYVDPNLDLPGFVESQTRVTDLYAAQMSDGSFFIWPQHRSDTSWFKAGKRAIKTATDRWVAVVARRAANTYDLIQPEDYIPEPDWAALPAFMEMVEAAFEDRMITHLDHPLIRKLRGFRNDDDE